MLGIHQPEKFCLRFLFLQQTLLAKDEEKPEKRQPSG